jgi:hypothetical protein
VSSVLVAIRIQLRGDAHSNVRGFDSTLVTQSTGQTSVLHGLAVKVSGHRPPLPAVGLSTPRVRDAVPPAHVTEHAAQLDQATTMQSTACIEGEADGTVVGSSVGEAVVGLRTKNKSLQASNFPDELAWLRIIAPRRRRWGRRGIKHNRGPCSNNSGNDESKTKHLACSVGHACARRRGR